MVSCLLVCFVKLKVKFYSKTLQCHTLVRVARDYTSRDIRVQKLLYSNGSQAEESEPKRSLPVILVGGNAGLLSDKLYGRESNTEYSESSRVGLNESPLSRGKDVPGIEKS